MDAEEAKKKLEESGAFPVLEPRRAHKRGDSIAVAKGSQIRLQRDGSGTGFTRLPPWVCGLLGLSTIC